MGFINNIKEGIRDKMRSFLQLEKAQNLQISITENMDEETKVTKNTIWYRGDTDELKQLYSQLPNKEDTFWGAVSTSGLEIRKIHTGVPSLIVDTLTNIVMTDYNGILFDDENKEIKTTWENIETENNMNDLLEDAICQSLYKGEGAFKISFDPEISQLPIIEYFSKDKIEIIRKRNRIREIVFKSIIQKEKDTFLLRETYGYGYITYKLINLKTHNEVPINSIDETKNYDDLMFDDCVIDKEGNILKYGSFMLAVPFKIKKDAIYDKKTDDFDALDEAWSQWMNALRDGRSKTYIPESLLPRNPKTGEILKPSVFDDKYIKIEDDNREDAKNQISVVQPSIPTDSYMNTYITALDLSLQGLISPSTLGIDTKKITDPNATAQREKEKATLYTRGNIIKSLENTLPLLVDLSFKGLATWTEQPIKDIKSNLDFGEYANPSFEAQVETVVKGKQGGVMSIEECVDELHGDSKDENWKKEEVKRLKAEQGIVDIEEPAVDYDLEMNNSINGINNNDNNDSNNNSNNKVDNSKKEKNEEKKKVQENVNE